MTDVRDLKENEEELITKRERKETNKLLNFIYNHFPSEQKRPESFIDTAIRLLSDLKSIEKENKRLQTFLLNRFPKLPPPEIIHNTINTTIQLLSDLKEKSNNPPAPIPYPKYPQPCVLTGKGCEYKYYVDSVIYDEDRKDWLYMNADKKMIHEKDVERMQYVVNYLPVLSNTTEDCNCDRDVHHKHLLDISDIIETEKQEQFDHKPPEPSMNALFCAILTDFTNYLINLSDLIVYDTNKRSKYSTLCEKCEIFCNTNGLDTKDREISKYVGGRWKEYIHSPENE